MIDYDAGPPPQGSDGLWMIPAAAVGIWIVIGGFAWWVGWL